jgi:hypothetical protein
MNDQGGVRQKLAQVQWVDSESRFFARVSAEQDSPPLIRMDVVMASDAGHNLVEGEMGILEDNIFIAVNDVLLLRPYGGGGTNSSSGMDADSREDGGGGGSASLCELAVTVDNFWSAHESGGNSGRIVRRATIYVTGETEVLGRLCSSEQPGGGSMPVSKRARRSVGVGGGDQSGVRGLFHVLQGPINLRRLRTKDASFGDDDPNTTTESLRWVCVDYSSTHHVYCAANPTCKPKDGPTPAFVNPGCLQAPNLMLERNFDSADNTNAIAIVQRGGSSGVSTVVGFVSRELSECLSPAIDASVIFVGRPGIYSEKRSPSDQHYRVWFPVQVQEGRLDATDTVILRKLGAVRWWVSDV